MKLNPLIKKAKAVRHTDCCEKQVCCGCGSHVSTYSCHGLVIADRPETVHEDWWTACDNADCEHAYGEGSFQLHLEWIWFLNPNQPMVKVWPRNKAIRDILVHPSSNIGFPDKGPIDWPDDEFTARSIADGDVFTEEAKAASRH